MGEKLQPFKVHGTEDELEQVKVDYVLSHGAWFRSKWRFRNSLR